MLGLVRKRQSPQQRRSLQAAYHRLDVILDKRGVGIDWTSTSATRPTSVGAATLPRTRVASALHSGRVFVPITHDLVHAATVNTAGQVAHVLYPVTKDARGACPQFPGGQRSRPGIGSFRRQVLPCAFPHTSAQVPLWHLTSSARLPTPQPPSHDIPPTSRRRDSLCKSRMFFTSPPMISPDTAIWDLPGA